MMLIWNPDMTLVLRLHTATSRESCLSLIIRPVKVDIPASFRTRQVGAVTAACAYEASFFDFRNNFIISGVSAISEQHQASAE